MTPPDPARRPAPDADGSFADLVRDGLAWIDESGGSGEVGAIGLGPGTIPADRFELLGEVGRGTFGVVYRALDRVLGREVAIKVPRPELVLSDESRRRFRREARALAGLDHPHLASVLEAGVLGPACYLVSPYCPGPDLAGWLRRHDGPVPWRAAARMLAGLADAVAHAHGRGVVHRDIKPSNVLLFPGGPGEPGPVPRLGDFGLACLLEEVDDATLSGLPLGSPPYMSPEQARGRHREVGPAADVYALGATLYEMLAGTPPFHAPSLVETLRQVLDDEPRPLRAARPDVPRDLETICLRCLRKDPARRYESARALREDLVRLLDGEPIRARAVGPAERLAGWAARPARVRDAGVTLLALGSTLSALSVGCLLATALGVIRPPRPPDAIREVCTTLTLFDLPMAIAGALILRRPRLGVPLGLASSLAFLASVAYSWTFGPLFTFGGTLGEQSPRSLFEGMMFLMAALGAAMAGLAVVARRAEAARRDPDPDPDPAQ